MEIGKGEAIVFLLRFEEMQTGFGKVAIVDLTGKSNYSTSIDIGGRADRNFREKNRQELRSADRNFGKKS